MVNLLAILTKGEYICFSIPSELSTMYGGGEIETHLVGKNLPFNSGYGTPLKEVMLRGVGRTNVKHYLEQTNENKSILFIDFNHIFITHLSAN